MEYKRCPNCGNNLFHNKGISKKTGKPYENYKCGQCDYIKWVDQIPVINGDTGKEIKADAEIDQGERMITLLTDIRDTLQRISERYPQIK